VEIRNESPEIINSINHDIIEAQLENNMNFNANGDPNTNYNILHGTVQSIIDKHIIVKKVRFKKHRHKLEPWITRGIINSIKTKDKLLRELRRTNPNTRRQYHDFLKTKLKEYSRILRKIIRTAKRSYFHEYFEQNKSNMKTTWTKINEVIKKNTPTITQPTSFQYNNSTIDDPQLVSNCFNEHFSTIGSKLASSIQVNHINHNHTAYLHNPTNSHFSFQTITEPHILDIVNNLSPKNSYGHDKISTKMLKKIIPSFIHIITKIINQCIENGSFPTLLKLAKVIPIHKKDNQSIFGNYRPISILPSISKIFEKVMHHQIDTYFRINDLFFQSQHGFRKHHSCETAAIELTDRIIQLLDLNQSPFAIFLDLSKAFDTIDHHILLSKLSHYGFEPQALSLMESYLSERMQYVNYENTSSSKLPLSVGIPQGAILAPLLFAIYINDLPNVSNLFTPLSYADDTTLIATSNTFTSPLTNLPNHNLINQELNKYTDWLSVNKLSINVTKTKGMAFKTTNKKLHPLNLTINDTPIEIVEEFNFLGITIDHQLNWNPHVTKTANKISSVNGILARLKNTFPISALLNIYHSLISSHINYGLIVWGYRSNRISQLQKKSIRIISKSHFIAHSEPLIKKHRLLKVEDIMQLKQLSLFFKIMNQQAPAYLCALLPIMPHLYHDHNTRFNDRHQIPLVKKDLATKCYRYSLPLLLNSFDHDILLTVTHTAENQFKSRVKKHLIAKYSSVCNITNCYVCHVTSDQ